MRENRKKWLAGAAIAVFILLSLSFVIFYFVVYPRKLYKKQKE